MTCFPFSLTVHRLAAKSFIQTKDMGILETAAEDVKVIVQISLESGVISSHTAFIAINKDLKQPVKGSPAHRDIPRPMLLGEFEPPLDSQELKVQVVRGWGGKG